MLKKIKRPKTIRRKNEEGDDEPPPPILHIKKYFMIASQDWVDRTPIANLLTVLKQDINSTIVHIYGKHSTMIRGMALNKGIRQIGCDTPLLRDKIKEMYDHKPEHTFMFIKNHDYVTDIIHKDYFNGSNYYCVYLDDNNSYNLYKGKDKVYTTEIVDEMMDFMNALEVKNTYGDELLDACGIILDEAVDALPKKGSMEYEKKILDTQLELQESKESTKEKKNVCKAKFYDPNLSIIQRHEYRQKMKNMRKHIE